MLTPDLYSLPVQCFKYCTVTKELPQGHASRKCWCLSSGGEWFSLSHIIVIQCITYYATTRFHILTFTVALFLLSSSLSLPTLSPSPEGDRFCFGKSAGRGSTEDKFLFFGGDAAHYLGKHRSTSYLSTMSRTSQMTSSTGQFSSTYLSLLSQPTRNSAKRWIYRRGLHTSRIPMSSKK